MPIRKVQELHPELLIIKTFPDERHRKQVEVMYAGRIFRTRLETLLRGAKPYIKLGWDCAIYKFYNEDGILIYLGKTENINKRFNGHREKSCFANAVSRVEVSWFENDADMHIYEPYLINKLKPLHNKEFVTNMETTLDLPELVWHDFTDFWRGIRCR